MTEENTQDPTGGQTGQSADPLMDALKKAQAEADAKTQQEANESENMSDSSSESQKLVEDMQKMTEVAQRALADLANFKRRTEEERAHVIVYANLELIKDLLPVLDNFQRAQTHLPENMNDDTQNWVNGILQTFKQFQDALTKRGLTEMKTVGEKFDPHSHEAMLQGPGEKDVVVEELEKGYLLGEKVVRTAKVKVGNGETA